MIQPRCPHCEFSYGWDGKFCSHCHLPYPLRSSWAACAEPNWFYRHHPSVSNRKLALFGCACVRVVLRFLPHPEAAEIVAAVEEAADRGRPVAKSVQAAARRLRAGIHRETPGPAPARHAANALLQLADPTADLILYNVFHAASEVATAAALEQVPELPDEQPARPAFSDDPARPRPNNQMWQLPSDMTPVEQQQWEQFQAAMTRTGEVRARRMNAATAATVVLCDLYRDIVEYPFEPQRFDPDWRTSTAVAMARGMHESRDFSAMPILADALQDAGCDDPEVLGHCRGEKPHCRGCWVIDRLLHNG